MRPLRARIAARVRRTLGSAPQPLPVSLPGALLEWRRHGAEPLAQAPDAGAGGPLRVAFVIPAFRRGSGGHATIANLVRGLEALGHECSLWLADDEGRHAGETAAETQLHFRTFFGALRAPLNQDFDGWAGADVVVATGWQTVFRTLRLPGCRARAYLVQDHEPEFYPTSAEALWAADSYRQGLHCIAASPWLADTLRRLYAASASHFDLGVDHSVYRPSAGPRREDLVIFYARAVTPRRAVPLGLLALEELRARRPQLEIAIFGESRPLPARFEHSDLGVLSEAELARLYGRASVGIVLSLTNPSRLHGEMLACELPCVDVASESMLACFGAYGPIELGPLDPLGLAAAIEGLLDDGARRSEHVLAGRSLVAGRTWEAAAAQVQDGLRLALGRSGV
jgi:O-antigen biosynthesis protein